VKSLLPEKSVEDPVKSARVVVHRYVKARAVLGCHPMQLLLQTQRNAICIDRVGFWQKWLLSKDLIKR
jgi:hypothetical protein